jgi:hypothetical protein
VIISQFDRTDSRLTEQLPKTRKRHLQYSRFRCLGQKQTMLRAVWGGGLCVQFQADNLRAWRVCL